MDFESRPMTTTVLTLMAAGLSFAGPVAYEIRPSEGTVLELSVEKTGLLSGKKHNFTFSRYQGTLLFDRDAPESSTITFSIESASVFCHDSWLSAKDLKKVQEYAVKDMLAAERYPTIMFRSTTIQKTGAGRFDARGMLMIRDVMKPVVVSVSLRTDSDGVPILEGESRIRLTEFGLKPPTALLGTIGTKNEMAFHFVVSSAPRAAGASQVGMIQATAKQGE